MPHERRSGIRRECTGTSCLQVTGKESEIKARVVNLSAEGCLLAFPQPLPLTQGAMVEIAFEVNQLPFRVRAQVRSAHADTLVGFHFPALSRRVQVQLQDLLEELLENHQRHVVFLQARAAVPVAQP